ncbi:MAG TPA: PQQ-binding-like beta-propeller repeat protein [Ilumatobacteraceae bacterium]|nr:PQQ-binding-like beta-propeller repeat protein [Ilumatobacteraceae bacterium]
MSRSRTGFSGIAVVAAVLFAGTAVIAAPGGSQWISAGGDLQNTRSQPSETKLTVDNVASLTQKWAFTTGGDVSATPAVDGNTVYVPDWAGNLYAVNKNTGQQIWKVSIAAASGIPFDKARATPAVSGNKVIIGTQGSILVPGGGPGGKILAFDKTTGALLWSTSADLHPASIITQSATVFDGRVYVGVASLEEALAGFVPGYPCCTFRGSMLALDVETGQILWRTSMAPPGYSGNAVWGSSPAIDVKRGQLYIATGNNYSVPQSVLDCVAAAAPDPEDTAACIAADDHFDSIMALDLRTGVIRWAKRAIPFDAWTTSCLPPPFGDGSNCPEPEGPDYDFGQAPAIFSVKDAKGRSRDLVGAGQKSGQYWALDPATGAEVWVTRAGPGGTGGGLQWGSAVDGKRVYTANANSNAVPWPLPSGAVTTSGVWSGLDAATGQIIWQRSSPNPSNGLFGDTSGPPTTANGVVYACSLEPQGHMYALDAATGTMLWSFASGGSCLSGAAISNGTLYWGSGYSNFGAGTPNNKLYAFGLPA